MNLVTAFVVADPKALKPGICTRCGGYRPGWGAGWDGKCCITMQHGGGEVRNQVCGRCDGTGKEPIGWWEKFKAGLRGEVYP